MSSPFIQIVGTLWSTGPFFVHEKFSSSSVGEGGGGKG